MCDQSSPISTTSPLLSHYAHDAFRAHVTPLADTPENRAHVATVTAAIRTGANAKPLASENILETAPAGPRELLRAPMDEDTERRRAQLASGYFYRQQRRFAATIASPGGRALLLLDHIDALGGSCTGAALAERTGWTRHEISRLVGRLVVAGCVTKPDRFTVQTCEDWQSTLDERVIEMPTFGSKAVLEAQLLDAREAYQTQRLQEAVDCQDPAQYERMRTRIAAILVTLDTIAKLRVTLVSWAVTTMQDRHEPVLKRILTRYASQDAREAAELRNRAAAGRRRLASTERAAAQRAGYYQRQGLTGGQVAHMLTVDGYSHHTIGAVLQ